MPGRMQRPDIPGLLQIGLAQIEPHPQSVRKRLKLYCAIQRKLGMEPTTETYGELQAAYDVFNAELFGGSLPNSLITLQRERKSYGYFSAERFQKRDGTKTDEIAMNPLYFAVVPLVEIMQTLSHEMAHLWQHHFGTPGRGRYHNAEWAEKMEAIGLMPSSTGKPGGKKTGDSMADYPIEGGPFLNACKKLLTRDYSISWYDRFPSAAIVQAGQHSHGLEMELPASLLSVASSETAQFDFATSNPAENKSNRSKYACQACGYNVWGKPALKIICGECHKVFTETR